MNSKILLCFLLVLALSFSVSADYNFYDTMGNNGKYSSTQSAPATSAYQAIAIPGATATFVEPIVFDANNDGITEVFIQQSGVVGIFEGTDVDSAIGAFGGEQAISPVACDINGDGRKDYVTIFEENGTSFLTASNYNGAGVFTVFAQMNVTTTNAYGNIACGRFYQAQGDTRNYAMWVDNNKLLYIMTAAGSTFTGVNVSVEDALTEEINFNIYPHGSHRTIFSLDMDPSGDGTIIFYAGRKAYAYFSDGGSDQITIQPASGGLTGYDPSDPSLGSVSLYGPVDAGGKAVMVHWDNDLGNGAANGEARPFYRLLRISGFPVRSLSSPGSGFSIDPINRLTPPTAAWFGIQSPTAFGRYNSTDGADTMFTLMWDAAAATGFAQNVGNFSVISTGGTVIKSALIVKNQSNQGDSKAYGTFMADMNKDGILDLLLARGGTADNWDVGYYSGLDNYSNFIHLVNITSPAFMYEQALQVVDMNGDGSPDLLISPLMNDQTFAIMSSAFGGSNNIAFSVSLNNTLPFESIQKITMAQNSSDFNYNYAAICDLSDATIWNEQFLLGYNFSRQNVSLNVFPPEQFLVFNGLQFTVNATFPQFDLLKEGNTGIREVSRVRLKYSAPTNSTVDLLLFGSDFQVTGYFRINKTGLNVEVSKVFFGNGTIVVATTTIPTNAVDFSLVFEPIDDIVGNYFGVSIQFNDVEVATTSTAQFSGSDIQNAEVFTDSPGTIRLTQLGLFATHDPTPGFVEFQNGQRIDVGGVIIENPPPQSRIQGDGYQVLPDFNNIFYSQCSYSELGTFTQRHFIAPTGTVGDYSNFRDVTVTITNTSTNGEGEDSNAGNSGLADFFGLDGIFTDSQVSFMLWLLITLLVAGAAFLVHWILGTVAFVAMLALGVVLGWMPLWVVLILVIISAALVAVAFRTIFTGS